MPAGFAVRLFEELLPGIRCAGFIWLVNEPEFWRMRINWSLRVSMRDRRLPRDQRAPSSIPKLMASVLARVVTDVVL